MYTLFFFLFLFKRDFSDLFEIESMNDRVGEGAEAEGEADSAEQGAWYGAWSQDPEIMT